MEVILLEKVRNLGSLGDKVTVRPGYGRNFLIPQNKAVPATKRHLAEFEHRRAELEEQAAQLLQDAQARAESLAHISCTISARAADEGKLYGSIGVREVAQAITEAGVKIEKSEVMMPAGPIRRVGEFDITVQLHTDVETALKLTVIEDKSH